MAYRGGDAALAKDEIALVVTEFAAEDQYYAFDRLPPFPVPWRHPLKCISWLTSLVFGFVSLTVFAGRVSGDYDFEHSRLGISAGSRRAGRTDRQVFVRVFRCCRWHRASVTIALGCGCGCFGADCPPMRLRTRGSSRPFPGSLRLASSIDDRVRRCRGASCCCRSLAAADSGAFFAIEECALVASGVASRGLFPRAEAAVREFITALRIPHHFWLGLRGFIGTFLWLLPPTAVFATLRDTSKPGQVILTLLCGVMLIRCCAGCRFCK